MELLDLTAEIFLLGFFRFVVLWLERTDPRLPPFPRKPRLVVGNLFDVQADTRSQFKEWRKQCGDIFSIKMCGTLTVVLNGYDVIREALSKKAEFFSDRPSVFIDEATGIPAKGIVFSSGSNWKEQRSVGLAILRRFGMGKIILAEKIQEEVTCYVNCLDKEKDQSVDIRTLTNISTSNIICSIIGQRFHHDDKDFQNMLKHLNFVASTAQNAGLINFVTWLKYLPGDIFAAKKITEKVKAMMSGLIKIIDKIRRDSVDSNDTDNFIDAYIAERNQKIKDGLFTYLDDENLIRIVLDLFTAGTETTSTTIYWCVLYMLNNPDVQEKVYDEIKELVGTERTPNMQDRSKLPYLNAVILETQRLASVVPLSLPHKCSKDVTLRGYSIPKDTFIIPNLDSVLHDQTIWGEDVMSFRPDRFLDSTGKLMSREEMIPFGIGPRVCLGESLAQMELFLFLSNMFQKFQFQSVEVQPPSWTDYVFGLACGPQPFEVKIALRE